MHPGGAPADLPPALVADHVQLPVVGPGAVLRQMPGVAVGDAAGVLGVLRAQDLRVQMGGLQPRPRLVERGPRVGGPVAELGGGRGVTGGQRGEKLLGRRLGSVGFRVCTRSATPRSPPPRPSRRPIRVILKLPLRQMLRIRDLNFAEARTKFTFCGRNTVESTTLSKNRWITDPRQGPAAGARTTNGTAGKYAAISERDLRSAAVP